MQNKQRLSQLQQDVAGLEAQKRTLGEDLAYKQTDAFIEESARNDLNLIKPGEHVFVVKESEEMGNVTNKGISAGENSLKVPAITKSNPQLWLDLLVFGK